MWGDPEGALRLESSDSLAAILFQVCGPAHVPHQDPRWQELLHGYDIWIHVEPRDASGVIDQACQNISRNAPQSSNLAAFSIHVTRMLTELASSFGGTGSSSGSQNNSGSSHHQHSAIDEFSNRIATVGRARAAAGCLNLLRILIHAVMVRSRSDELQQHGVGDVNNNDDNDVLLHHTDATPDGYLQECFLYRSRDSVSEHDAGADLLDAILLFAVSNPPLTGTVPELYDAAALAMQLALVLLSSQLYQPMISSFQRKEMEDSVDEEGEYPSNGYFWDGLFEQAIVNMQKQQEQRSTAAAPPWTPRTLLLALIDWTHRRPVAPARSVAQHNFELARSVAAAKGEKVGTDGMYENHMVVMASSPHPIEHGVDAGEQGTDGMGSTSDGISASKAITRRHSNILIDATKGVLILSSSIILLPFRLMQLALGLWGNKERGYDQAHRKMLLQHSSLTKDVLWLSESSIGDLASCLLLLILNNERAVDNPFRDEVAALTDNRWETDGHGLPDLPDLPSSANGGGGDEEFTPLMALSVPQSTGTVDPAKRNTLAVNFESLFELFGRTSHNEVGALLLYTLMQSSLAFAESLAVRSDLDTLILPLLRTLYFSSSVRHYAAQDFVSRAGRRPSSESMSSSSAGGGVVVSIRNCPFRSQSQLYVVIILLLLFSQDASFGSDAFRRNVVSSVPWYQERHLKDANLGSVLLLCLLRSLTFNLNRLRDSFLLSNCCAILMNLSPAISDLHEYAAMRLASTTVSSMKKYAELHREHPDTEEEELSTPTAMHGEVCRTFLRVLKQCLNAKNVDRNLNLVYALVYHQADFKRITAQKGTPFKKGQTDRILKIVAAASSVIERQGDARTAAKALKILSENMYQIRDAISDKKRRSDGDGFTFTYEEEADPEIFFVPYVWEVIVCAATSSSIEWHKSCIRVFPLLEDPANGVHEHVPPIDQADFSSPNAAHEFSKDVSDVV